MGQIWINNNTNTIDVCEGSCVALDSWKSDTGFGCRGFFVWEVSALGST